MGRSFYLRVTLLTPSISKVVNTPLKKSNAFSVSSTLYTSQIDNICRSEPADLKNRSDELNSGKHKQKSVTLPPDNLLLDSIARTPF